MHAVVSGEQVKVISMRTGIHISLELKWLGVGMGEGVGDRVIQQNIFVHVLGVGKLELIETVLVSHFALAVCLLFLLLSQYFNIHEIHKRYATSLM